MNNKKLLVALSMIATILTNGSIASQGGPYYNDSESSSQDREAIQSVFKKVMEEDWKLPQRVLNPYVKTTEQQIQDLANKYGTAFEKLMEKGSKELLAVIPSLEDRIKQKGKDITPDEGILDNIKFLKSTLDGIGKSVGQRDLRALNQIDVHDISKLAKEITEKANDLVAREFDCDSVWDEMSSTRFTIYRVQEAIKTVQWERIQFNFSKITLVLNKICKDWKLYSQICSEINSFDIDSTLKEIQLLCRSIEKNNHSNLVHPDADKDVSRALAVLHNVFDNDEDPYIQAVIRFYDEVKVALDAMQNSAIMNEYSVDIDEASIEKV